MLELRTRKKLTRKSVLILKSSLLVLLVLSFFSSYLKPVQGEKTVLSFFQNLIYPFQYGFESSKDFLTGSFNHYINLVHVAEENEKLKQENLTLKARLLNAKELEDETIRLKRLLHFSEKFPQDSLEATRIIGSFYRLSAQGVRISSGTSSGVYVGMPIISPSGVVGKVIRTSYGFSDVMLLTDSNFVLDVLLERTRGRSLLRGLSPGRCVLEVHKDSDIKVGDTLVTSGLLNIFPKGLPIGVVTRIKVDVEETVKTAEVNVWAKIGSLEGVLIVKKGSSSKKKKEDLGPSSNI